MRAVLLVVAFFVALATMGSSCLYDEFVITANATVEETFPINPGTTTSGSGTESATVVNLLPGSLNSEDIENINNYDLTVFVAGTYGGRVNGTIEVSSNGATYTLYATLSSAPWDSLKAPQSALAGSDYLTINPAGKAALEAALNAFKTNDQATVWVRFNWGVSASPIPAGLSVTVRLLSQISFKVSVS